MQPKLKNIIAVIVAILSLTPLTGCKNQRLKHEINAANSTLPVSIYEGYVLTSIEYNDNSGNGEVILNCKLRDDLADTFEHMLQEMSESDRIYNHDQFVVICTSANEEVKTVIDLALERHCNIAVRIYYKRENGYYTFKTI